jgi:hypothetical protein
MLLYVMVVCIPSHLKMHDPVVETVLTGLFFESCSAGRVIIRCEVWIDHHRASSSKALTLERGWQSACMQRTSVW